MCAFSNSRDVLYLIVMVQVAGERLRIGAAAEGVFDACGTDAETESLSR